MPACGIDKIRQTLEERACNAEERAKTAVQDLLDEAAEFRDVAARIQVPTYAEYEAATEEEGNKYVDGEIAYELLRAFANNDSLYRQPDLSALDNHEFCEILIARLSSRGWCAEEIEHHVKERMHLIVDQAKEINARLMTAEEAA